VIIILQFPIQYSDEDIRSLAYRYHIESPNSHFQQSYIELFSIKKKTQNSLSPCNLNFFLDTLSQLSEDKIHFIKSHTYLPFVMPFLERSKWNQLIVEPSTFTAIWKIFDDTIKYCPDCMLEDSTHYGQCYVHREHQFRYVDVCITHGCSLITQCRECHAYYAENQNQELTMLPRCKNGHPVAKINKKNVDPMIVGLVNSYMALIDYYEEVDADTFIQKLNVILANKGYIHMKGAIYKNKVIEDMFSYFGSEKLCKFGLNKEKLLVHRAITMLFSTRHASIYIHFYLFLIQFLVGDIRSFLFEDPDYSIPLPFGIGPWLCKNKICPYRDLPVITSCIRIVKQYTSGHFTCPFCGYSYIRRYEHGETDNPNKFRVSDMGFLWKESVGKRLSEGRSILSISKEIGSDMGTIKKFKLNMLDTSRSKKRGDINQYKMEFMGFIKCLPEVSSRREIRKTFGYGKYDKLMKADRDWMEKVLPSRQINMSKHRDYQLLDEEAYDQAEKAFEQLLLENPPQRITKKLILKRTPGLIRGRLFGINKDQFSRLIPC
jgi:predicted RNA-binding Zn-ribbon protein involved in translation (DUF1610 family)